MPLTDQTRVLAKEIVARYPRPRSALLPMLHLVQSEDGYVSPEGVRFCAEELGLTKAEVGAVATFYTMYKRRPAGDYLVSVCTNTLCDVLGGEEIYRALSEHLGVGHDETTTDGKITLEHAECLAACDYAPVVTVNYEFFDQQTVDSATGVVTELQAGGLPLPSRGAPLCTFKEISRQLAGFMDEREGALGAGPAGEPTLVGNRLAVQRGETAPAYGAPAPLDGRRESSAPAAAAPAASAPAASAPAAAAPAAAAPAAAAPAAAAPAPVETKPAATGPAVEPSAEERSTTPESGERAGSAAAPTTAAEQSAAAGTAHYGGQPDEPSSGGGEGGAAGLDTSASDPDAGPGSGVTHESDAAKADSPEPAAEPAAPAAAPAPDRPRPTNRGRKTTRKEG